MRNSAFHSLIAANLSFTALFMAMLPSEEPTWLRVVILVIVILVFLLGYLVGKYDETAKKNAAKN